jgi:hypothetical protein
MMAAHTRASTAFMLVIGSLLVGCNNGGDLLSVTSPTPLVATSPVPPSTQTLNGRVTETPPTSQTGIGGALVRITTGPDAGRSATTNIMGFYTIPNVAVASTVQISAEGYVESSGDVDSGREGRFQLMPRPVTKTSTLRDTLDDRVGSCSDGVSQRPCHILTLPIHNDGPLEATLSWEPAASADLDLSLFRASPLSLIARSGKAGSESERINLHLAAGLSFELHVTYASGSAPATYTLRVVHQN